MATPLQTVRSFHPNHFAVLVACACALALAMVSPQAALANTLTICKQTLPSPDPLATSFTFFRANSFGNLGSFQLKDSTCKTFNLTGKDQFNRVREAPPPAGWTLSNIACTHTKSAVAIVGANSNPGFQPGDTAANVDLADPNVTCTFVNTCTYSADLSTGVAKWFATRPNGTTALAHPVAPNSNWASYSPPPPSSNPFPPGTSWVQPANSSTLTAEADTIFIYRLRFVVPCPGKTLVGWFAADNATWLFIDGNPPIPCMGNTTGECFKQAYVTTIPSTAIAPGGHILTFIVLNDPNTVTGLLAHIVVQ